MIYNTNRKSREVYGIHFYGNEASDYGKEQGYVDYRTFARAFDAVMNNSIMQELESAGYYFEPVQDGSSDYSDEIDELRDAADDIEKLNELGLNVFAELGIDRERILQIEREETWLTPQQALELGIVTEVRLSHL
mgnify:CR=1 FL=1